MNTTIVISEVLSTSWKNVKSQIWILAGLVIGMCLISFTISLLMSPLSTSIGGMLISSLISILISSIFALGYIKNMFQTMDGDEPQFSAYMSHPSKIVNYFIAGLLFSLSLCIGLVFFIIPGIYLYLRLQFYGQFIVDENAGSIESLKKSWNLTKGYELNHYAYELSLFLLMLAQLFILIIGALLFLVGLLVAYPLVIMSQCYVYRLLNRQAYVEQNDL